MQKKKKLKLLMLIIIFLIIGIFILAYNLGKDNDTINYDYSSNVGTVYNQGKEVLEYDEKIFLLNEDTNSIIKYDKATNKYSEIINSITGKLRSSLFIMNNKLIYSYNNKTYFYDLNTSETSEFLNGNIFYINEDIYIYTMKVGSMDYLYLSSYDDRTMIRTNDISFHLAIGNNIELMDQKDGILLFTSKNSDNSSSLFSVNLKDSNTTLLYKTDNSDIYRYEIVNAVISPDNEKNYFTVCEYSIGSSTNEESLISTTIYNCDKYSYTEFQDELVNNKIICSSDNIIYEKYNSELNKYEWTNGEDIFELKDIINFAYGDVTEYFSVEDYKLKLLEKSIMDIDNNTKLKQVLHYNDKYYILLNSTSSKQWYTCDENGNNLVKIYEWR